MFERIVMTWPSCSRVGRRPVWRCSSNPCFFIRRIDPLGIDGLASGGSPLALEERGDPPVAIGRPLVDEAADVGNQFEVASTGLRTALRASSLRAVR